jgi:hypothetical protein
MSVAAREQLEALLKKDLVGPQCGPEEVLRGRPSDVYLTGALFPQTSATDAEEVAAEEDDSQEEEAEDGTPGAAVPMGAMRRPSSMGISFALQSTVTHVLIEGSAGRYARRWEGPDGKLSVTDYGRGAERWVRAETLLATRLPVQEGLHHHSGPDGLLWWVRATRHEASWQVTLALTNTLKPPPGRVEGDAATFFQVGFRVKADGGELLPRRPGRPAVDEDSQLAEVLYRSAREWAVGHTCGATWEGDDGVSPDTVTWVESTWLPRERVKSVDPRGHQLFRDAPQEAFAAAELAKADGARLSMLLAVVPDAWSRWLDETQQKAEALASSGGLSAHSSTQVELQLARARAAVVRMRAAIALISADSVVRESFQRAQEAMRIQRSWKEQQEVRAGKKASEEPLVWRPFQLGFQLLCLESLARPAGADGLPSPDRLTMDLLWFPTGGGKTEAYLALIAFVLVYRRLKQSTSPDDGRGVAVLIRYTLRLLTIQQFERAARLVLALEAQRRKPRTKGRLGAQPFSIGLWVGSGATPNTVDEARTPEGRLLAAQLARCPACGSAQLQWDCEPGAQRFAVRCADPHCPLAGPGSLGIWTVDEDIYRERPSVLIGTVDKFAQVVRRPETGSLFGRGVSAPELILQDELHLISGPLGTVTALYESAIDRLCTSPDGIPPKVIGSTATIRRAREQVLQLFNRSVFQFPPPVLDADDSCFGVTDHQSPGRVYIGVTSSGRSPKFSLQAVCASLLQAASELPETREARDAYWTLVAYFNSLRELGGAHVMMHDDVRDSLRMFAGLHGSGVRPRGLQDEPLELTSRVPSAEIPEALARLETAWPAQTCDLVLATNMLSVGVDIPRLGLMVVNGQPKSMAEYIQATSRVGRQKVPGLIVTVYNAGRPRDRSHFEAFRTWHQLLYREVEATSVTPFAPRARDKALHAVVVALVRHVVKAGGDDATLTDAEVEAAGPLVDWLVSRVRQVDAAEAVAVDRAARDFLEAWRTRGPLAHWWNDHQTRQSLLISAEAAARAGVLQGGAYQGAAWPTPNSMREVEPSTSVKLQGGR